MEPKRQMWEALARHDPATPRWLVIYYAYAMRYVEDIRGSDCEEFRLEQWMNKAGLIQDFEYPIFYIGQRMCLGKEMTYIHGFGFTALEKLMQRVALAIILPSITIQCDL
uniref:Cytochrome P450 n=1 Tax=Oryza nivara TaxID=4536 RepID=A0A0E0FUK1_ORYNI